MSFTTNTEFCIHILQVTGGKRAVELIRQSWVNRPLDTNEIIQLLSIAQHDQHTPYVSLLCQEISLSAQGLSFLHHAPTEKRPRFQESLLIAKSD